MSQKAQWENSREVARRIFIEGMLILDTPAHFGNGDAEGLTDIALVRDPLDGVSPLLTGASIAGALRNNLREYEKGYSWQEKPDAILKSYAERLFGHLDDLDPSNPLQKLKGTVHSWLMVDDALGSLPSLDAIELRDGVAISPKTRTAEQKDERGFLFDMELLPAGTTFPIGFEFWWSAHNDADLLPALVTALQGLERGDIRLGTRKRRGLGECHVDAWRVHDFTMNKRDDVLAWLAYRRGQGETKAHVADWFAAKHVQFDKQDNRNDFVLKGTFKLGSSLLIRSGSGLGDAPDMVHLQSGRNGTDVPILSGTSAAGTIRARAYRIANTLAGEQRAMDLINDMFGRRDVKTPTGSRVTVNETEIINPPPPEKSLVQSRIKIDRFTGGAYPQALFSEQPVFDAGETCVKIELLLRKPYDANEKEFQAEVGLLLLVLKDLWTGDLPLGGESSVGRGRIQGESATIHYEGKEWVITEQDERLVVSGKDKDGAFKDAAGELERCVGAFVAWTKEAR